ncbi:DUF368 domain-containing protein [Treponema sp.]|uniref:DUF368 domain-containing protein n=1 Tax=Treponema sp. TaxID=166 RepID=UPI00298E1E71|nr:DUF368 domain-containing protein [Treponema sp.]MCR5612093.1 DUF368 domain-containing protein [Treponema sp.]
MIEILKTFFIGIFVGIANVIPGVSGGTLVVVFNIYDKFVNAITLNVKKLIQNWKFVLPILLGMASGIVIFSELITILYTKCPDQTNFFFTGLLIGSIPLLINKAFTYGEKKPTVGLKIREGLFIFLGIVLIISFDIIQKKIGMATDKTITVLPQLTTMLFIKLFIGGILGAIAMIIPGISGSLIMLVLGIYPIIICSIKALLAKETFFTALFLLLPNGAGIIIGLLAGAKLISILLKKAPNETYSFILGLIIASCGLLIPSKAELGFINVSVYVLCVCAGFVLSYMSTKLDTGNSKEKK